MKRLGEAVLPESCVSAKVHEEAVIGMRGEAVFGPGTTGIVGIDSAGMRGVSFVGIGSSKRGEV